MERRAAQESNSVSERKERDAMNRQQKTAPAQRAAPPPVAWRPSRTTLRATFLIGISLLSGFAFKEPTTEKELTAPQQPAITTEAPEMLTEDTIQIIEIGQPIRVHHYLESVSLDMETQDSIWKVCKENPRLYCTVMAIARRETIFDPDAIGDNGNSLGLLQIQPRWHQERMDKLGVTDLMDPIQNAMVAVDYIDWIAERLTPDAPEDSYGTHALLMAYNQGWSGATGYWQQGIHDTEYSRAVVDYFTAYMNELGVEV